MAGQTSFILPHQQLHSTNSQMDGQIISQEQNAQFQCVKETSSYKNRLQEFAQRASLPLPAYYTVNEQDLRQSSKFRSTVEVDGEKYSSLNTFTTRKAAEQDAAKVALESISNNVKYCASKKTSDGVFPPIHEDKVFSKSILHEFAMKKNLEKPIYDTTILKNAVPLFGSYVVFDGVKYTGEHSVNKKEAEQLAARAAILSLLANSEVDSALSEIVLSKAKLISAAQGPSVHGQCSADRSVSQFPNSSAAVRTSIIKEIVTDKSDNVQPTSDMIKNVTSEEPQQSANKKARIPDNAIQSCDVNGNVSSSPLSLMPCVFNNHYLEKFPQPSLLPSHQTSLQRGLISRYPSNPTLPQPTLISNSHTLPQPSLLPNTHTISQPNTFPSFQSLPQPSLVPNTQTISQPNMIASTQSLPQPSLLPNTQITSEPSMFRSTQSLPQPSLLPKTQITSEPSMFRSTESLPQPSLLPNTQTISQPSMFLSTQSFPQPSLLPNTQTVSQPSMFPSTQSFPQPSSLLNSNTLSQHQLNLPVNPQPSSQSSLVPSSQTLPQPNQIPVTFDQFLDAQTPSNEIPSSNRRKKLRQRANKKARNQMHQMQMQTSNLPPSQVPSCTIAQ